MPWEPWERELFDELVHSTTCQCGGKKRKYMTFCAACYFSLPSKIRKALYRHFDDGYQEARIAAGRFLGEKKLQRFEVADEFRELVECA